MARIPGAWPNVLRFAAMVLVWGSSFLLIKLSLGAFSVPQIALLRVFFGATVLGIIMLTTRRRLPRSRRLWGHMAVVGAAQCGLPFIMTAWSGQYLPSSLSSIFNAIAPTMTVAFTPLLLKSERLTRVQVLGVVIGIVGVLVLIGPWRFLDLSHLADTLPAQLVMLCSATVYAFGLVYMRRFVSVSGHDAVTISFLQVSLASLPLLILIPAAVTVSVTFSLVPVGAILILGCIGTGVAYIWNTRIVRDWGATRASTVTYLMPMVGVILGVVVLGETIDWNEPIGGALILAGVVTSQLGAAHRRAVGVSSPVVT
ncbi:DMT family transporter [Subtercola endophyticus]|uniref:DMT family transporter n=1 Tax=Subtercola endophyticus TaxID=2895559 RepID=UPI001E490EA0|nr:DMT family transporter [Subtercola endophyticus]UFS58347.1 DMT family transporter [Subtercola endophyticus]